MARIESGRSAASRRVRGRGRRLQMALAMGLLLTFCYRDVRANCDNPPPLYVSIEAGNGLNPDEHHRALPTQFLVLQLRGGARFEKASFDDLWQRSKDALADELLQANEVSVAPGATVIAGLPRQSQASFVAVIGVFRQHAGDSWRAVAPLASVPSDRCTPQPAVIKAKPVAADAELKFQADGDRVENRTPPMPAHGGCS